MAVAKSKRYRQIVRSRRSLNKINSINKKGITITKFNNYANILKRYTNRTYCSICTSKEFTNTLCSNCYVIYFLNDYKPKNEVIYKEFRTRDLVKEFWKRYHYELSKTLFPSGRP